MLLVRSEQEKDISQRLKNFLEKMDVHVDVLTVTEEMDAVIVKQFVDFFTSPVSMFEGVCQILTQQTEITSHVLILSALSRRWFDFFLGFSCGSPVPLIIYDKSVLADMSDEFASWFTSFENEETLKKYFETENEIFKKHAAFMKSGKARETLLRLGTPITDEALAHSAAEGNIEEVTLFLAAGFSPDTRNTAGLPLLNIAARRGQREMLQFLIHAGAQLNLLAEDRNSTALIDGTLGKHKELVKDLIEAGADLNVQSKDGQTALIVAVGTGCEEIFEALLKAGANPDLTDKLGMSARKYASFFSKPAITSLFDKYAPL